ncbi:MAG: adenylate/guanylate cyclase domain-containing protein [Acidimicrobiales bacterium]|nr:adenylate/guanylate cyclase domain-containing protein [Acidimicrobiales bacterium]
MEQRVSVCHGPNGEEIAYASVGEGPVLVLSAWWTSHLELDWQDPEFRDFVLDLAETHRVVRYDRPGVGMSGRDDRPFDLHTEAAYLRAVMDAASTDGPADVLAISCGGPPAIVVATDDPARVRRIVFFGSYAEGPRISDPATLTALESLVRASWGLGSQTLSNLFVPDADASTVRRVAAAQRHTASAEIAARLLCLTSEMDVADRVERVHQPSLVLHRERDRTIPSQLGADLAAALPDAELQLLEGRAHLPWVEGDEITAAIRRFLTDGATAGATTRKLATVAFTDIVDSTSSMSELGDDRWRARLDALSALLTEEAAARGGELVKETGDGALVTFELPSNAFDWAIAVRKRAHEHGLALRIGLHTGEVELRGDDVTGRAVVIASRLCDLAAAGQIRASSTAVDLAAGRGFRTTHLGAAALKGIDADVVSYDVEPLAATGDAPTFTREGQNWRVSFRGTDAAVRHSKGVGDLAMLVEQRGTDVPAVVLMDGPDAAPRSGGDEVLDPDAVTAYRRRLGEIEDELDRADDAGDGAASERLEAERTALLDELRTASGLGGRTRRMGDDVERARKAVSARVRDAINKIGEVQPELAIHLAESVTTGRECRYR